MACGSGQEAPTGSPGVPPADPQGEEGAPKAAAPAEASTEPEQLPSNSIGTEPAPESEGSNSAPEEAQAKHPTETPTTPTESKPDPYPGWSTFVADNGASLRHPKDWKLHNTPGGLLLTAPGADPKAEWIAGTAVPANGVTDPLSLKARRILSQQVKAELPFLRRKGRGRAVETGLGQGAAYDFRGTAPTGQEVHMRVFAVIVEDTVGGITLMAEPKIFEQRVATVEKIFASLHRQEAKQAPEQVQAQGDVDAHILGRFRGESLASGDGVYVNTQLIYAFNANGTVLYGAQSAMSASKRDHTGQLEWTATGGTGSSMEKGTFTTKGGILTIRWEAGTRSTFAYSFEPDGSLVLRHPHTKKLINFYPRVR